MQLKCAGNNDSFDSWFAQVLEQSDVSIHLVECIILWVH